MLYSVIPNLEAELQVEDDDVRSRAIDLTGKIFLANGGNSTRNQLAFSIAL